MQKRSVFFSDCNLISPGSLSIGSPCHITHRGHAVRRGSCPEITICGKSSIRIQGPFQANSSCIAQRDWQSIWKRKQWIFFRESNPSVYAEGSDRLRARQGRVRHPECISRGQTTLLAGELPDHWGTSTTYSRLILCKEVEIVSWEVLAKSGTILLVFNYNVINIMFLILRW